MLQKYSMSKYKYLLGNYHAVEHADIAIDGITVLAGENGCGKSTLSRWLYYIINGADNLEKFLYQEYVVSLRNFVNRWEFVSRDILRNRMIGGDKQDLHGYKKITVDQFEQLLQVENFGTEDVERVEIVFVQTLETFADQLYDYICEENREVRKNRVLNFLDIKLEDFPTEKDAIDEFVKKCKRWIDKKTKELFNQVHERGISILKRMVNYKFEETDDFPMIIQLSEDGLELIDDNSLATIYNLQKAIYVDTPMAITSGANGNPFWNELQEIMLSAYSRELSMNTKILIKRIKLLIGGEAKFVDDEALEGYQELRFISENEEIDIELSKVATGVKTFVYLQRLLQNGTLNDNTLLLIDEPEAHLHPQWIVEYARLLVLINKYLGTKIMIASHNPDMVAAIQNIAKKEGIIDSTNFYLAQKTDGSHRYVYKKLGNDIEEIFRSFNIALDRIKLYGGDNI